jgi:uncharacterized SAM-binding protein YcdF (DUF218 family)
MIYLHKILPFLFYPFTIVIILFLIGIIYKKQFLNVAALAILLISSLPFFANNLMRFTEDYQRPVAPNTIEKADAIIVLSGFLLAIPNDKSQYIEWSDPDRFFAGLELLKEKKAPYLVFTGGINVWGPVTYSEGEILSSKAIALGLNKSNILLTNSARNTEEEAIALQELAISKNIHKIILITSAFHMKRAQYIFSHHGFDVRPFPVDFQISTQDDEHRNFLPNVHSLLKTQTAIRELIGVSYYLIKYSVFSNTQ